MKKFTALLTLLCFLSTGLGGGSLSYAAIPATGIALPVPGQKVHLSPFANPPVLKGLKVHPNNPFQFEFILDVGDGFSIPQKGERISPLQDESIRLIKYFLASLTVPEKDLWVNLSPYEKDRIVPDSFGLTEMGRDLLAQDYILKQVTASLIYPEDEVGKKFWKRVYEEAAKKYGTTNIPVNTFNKVWIVPAKAVVYENAKAGTAYVVESKLKVMLEVDYLSLEKHASPSVIPANAGIQNQVNSDMDPRFHGDDTNDVNQIGSQIIREIVIPELTKEVNEGKNFAQLRQVYNSLILATWYKKKIKDSILSKVYADKNKVQGIEFGDRAKGQGLRGKQSELSTYPLPLSPERIYQQYIDAFKKGVYNYIKEEADPVSGQAVPRKYFSGGMAMRLDMDGAMTTTSIIHEEQLNHADLAMVSVAVKAASPVAPATAKDDEGGSSRDVPDHFDFTRFAHKRILILDDNTEIMDAHRKLLADYFPQGHVATGTSPQAGLEQIKAWEAEGIKSSDILVITDYQFEGEATAIDLINPLRVAEAFEGDILIVSGSLISKTQIPGFSSGDFGEKIKREYGLHYLEKNGDLAFREQLLAKLQGVLERPSNPKEFVKTPLQVSVDPKVYIPKQVAYFQGGINDLEALLREDLLAFQRAAGDGDVQIGEFVRQISSRATFGSINRDLPIEQRAHNYRNQLYLVISDNIRDLRVYLQAKRLDGQANVQESLDKVQAVLERARNYAEFLNKFFFHMRGLDKLHAFKPLLESAIGAYQYQFEGKADASFDPNLGIAAALDELSRANAHLQQGVVQETMLEWGGIYSQYKVLKADLDQVLSTQTDIKTLAFMDRFCDQLNNFFGQYIKRFGLTNVKGMEGGRSVGRLVIAQGTEEEVLAKLETLTAEDIVVMDQNYSGLSVASTKARGFIFGQEGASHISTRARTLRVPLLILPNAIEYFRQFDGQDQWILMDSREGKGILRFISQAERDIAPAMQRSPIVVPPVPKDISGPLGMNMEEDNRKLNLNLEDMVSKMGYKAANYYYNHRHKVGFDASTYTLLNRFIEEVLNENPGVREQLKMLFSRIDKSKPQSVKESLEAMRHLFETLTVSQDKKQMIWDRLEDLRIPYLILRLTTGAEDLENYPGVGAGVYGSLERIRWANESTGEIPQENKDKLIVKMLEAYASFWSFEAYADREFYSIDHWQVGSALMIQEYLADAKYSVLVHTADPDSRDRRIMEIKITPGSGRGLSAPEAALQGKPLTLYYDKEKRQFITAEDPRTQYHPVGLTKTHYVDPQTGEVKAINKTDYLGLQTLASQITLASSIVKTALNIEELHGRAQDIEGVIDSLITNLKTGEKVDQFFYVQSRAQANIMPYSKGYGDRLKQQRVIERVAAWIKENGGDAWKTFDFYKGPRSEAGSLYRFVPDRDRSSDLINEFGTVLNGNGALNNLTAIYEFLMSHEAFKDVREGLLRRMFFYASGQHEEFMMYFKHLYEQNPDLFYKILPFSVVPLSNESKEDEQSWFAKVNGYSLKQTLTLIKLDGPQFVENVSLSDLVSILLQDDLGGKLLGSPLSRSLYPFLSLRKDYDQLLAQLPSHLADEIRVVTPQAVEHQALPVAKASAPVVKQEELATQRENQAIERVNTWFDTHGREGFKSLDFYKGRMQEASSLRRFAVGGAERASTLIDEFADAFNGLGGGENITAIYEFLMSHDEFADVREGLLRRMFFYASGRHNAFIDYFKKLYNQSPDLFYKILPFAIIPMSSISEMDKQWFQEVNTNAIRRIVTSVDFNGEQFVQNVSSSDLVSIILQNDMGGGLVNTPLSDSLFPYLSSRQDYEQILALLPSDLAARIRATEDPVAQRENELKQRLNAWLDQEGFREGFKSLDFYQGRQYEAASLQQFMPETYGGEVSTPSTLILDLGSVLRGSGTLEDITAIYHILMNYDEFQDVREGLLRRVFFYAAGKHAEFMEYFHELSMNDPDIFMSMLPYVIVPMNQNNPLNKQWFEQMNGYALAKSPSGVFKRSSQKIVDSLSLTDMVSFLWQMHEFGEIRASKGHTLDYLKEYFYPLLGSRKDINQIIDLLPSNIADEIKPFLPASPLEKPASSEPLSSYERTKAKFKESMMAFVKNAGIENIADLSFYSDFSSDPVQLYLPLFKKNGGLTRLLDGIIPQGSYNIEEQMGYVLDLLLNDPELASVKEGLLRRLFYEAVGVHKDFIWYLTRLYIENPEFLDRIWVYLLPEHLDSINWKDFDLMNVYLPTRLIDFSDHRYPEFIARMMAGLSDDQVLILFQSWEYAIKKGNRDGNLSPEIDKIVQVLKDQGRYEAVAAKGSAWIKQQLGYQSPQDAEPERVSPYEKAKAQFKESLRVFVQKAGVADIQNLDFYRGLQFDRVKEFIPVNKDFALTPVIRALMPNEVYTVEEQLTYLFDLLLTDPDFHDVREGLLRRILYAVQGGHSLVVKNIIQLRKDRPEFASLIGAYLLPDHINEDDWEEFAWTNGYLATRLINEYDLIEQDFVEEVIAVLTDNQVITLLKSFEYADSMNHEDGFLSIEALHEIVKGLKKHGRYEAVYNVLSPFLRQKLDAPDRAMQSSTGGIDFTVNQTPLEIKNSGEGIQFRLDPAQLKQLQNAPGFYPVILNIQPLPEGMKGMEQLRLFLGLKSKNVSP